MLQVRTWPQMGERHPYVWANLLLVRRRFLDGLSAKENSGRASCLAALSQRCGYCKALEGLHFSIFIHKKPLAVHLHVDRHLFQTLLLLHFIRNAAKQICCESGRLYQRLLTMNSPAFALAELVTAGRVGSILNPPHDPG